MRLIIILLFLLISSEVFSQIIPPIVKGSDLDVATTPTDADFLIGIQGGHTKKFPYSYVIASMGGSIVSVFNRTGVISAQASDYASFYYPLGSNPAHYLTNVTQGMVRRLFTANSPLLYDTSTATFSLQYASGSQPGGITAANFTTFNNKENTLFFYSGLSRIGNVVRGKIVGSDTGMVTPAQKIIWDNKQDAFNFSQNKIAGRFSSGSGPLEQISLSSDFALISGVLTYIGSSASSVTFNGRSGPTIVPMTGDYTYNMVGAYPLVGNPSNFLTTYTETDPRYQAFRDSIRGASQAVISPISGGKLGIRALVASDIPALPYYPSSGNPSSFLTPTTGYTQTQINNFFSGGTSISGYNKSAWDAAASAVTGKEDVANKATNMSVINNVKYVTTALLKSQIDSLHAAGIAINATPPIRIVTGGASSSTCFLVDGTGTILTDGSGTPLTYPCGGATFVIDTANNSQRGTLSPWDYKFIHQKADSTKDGFISKTDWLYFYHKANAGAGGAITTETDPFYSAYGATKATTLTIGGVTQDLSTNRTWNIPSGQIQSKWHQTNTSALDYIVGKPNVYIQSKIDSIFAGTSAESGYNKSQWDTAYARSLPNGNLGAVTKNGAVISMNPNTIGTNEILDGGVHGVDLENVISPGTYNGGGYDGKGRLITPTYTPYITKATDKNIIDSIHVSTPLEKYYGGNLLNNGNPVLNNGIPLGNNIAPFLDIVAATEKQDGYLSAKDKITLDSLKLSQKVLNVIGKENQIESTGGQYPIIGISPHYRITYSHIDSTPVISAIGHSGRYEDIVNPPTLLVPDGSQYAVQTRYFSGLHGYSDFLYNGTSLGLGVTSLNSSYKLQVNRDYTGANVLAVFGGNSGPLNIANGSLMYLLNNSTSNYKTEFIFGAPGLSIAHGTDIRGHMGTEYFVYDNFNDKPLSILQAQNGRYGLGGFTDRYMNTIGIPAQFSVQSRGDFPTAILRSDTTQTSDILKVQDYTATDKFKIDVNGIPALPALAHATHKKFLQIDPVTGKFDTVYTAGGTGGTTYTPGLGVSIISNTISGVVADATHQGDLAPGNQDIPSGDKSLTQNGASPVSSSDPGAGSYRWKFRSTGLNYMNSPTAYNWDIGAGFNTYASVPIFNFNLNNSTVASIDQSGGFYANLSLNAPNVVTSNVVSPTTSLNLNAGQNFGLEIPYATPNKQFHLQLYSSDGNPHFDVASLGGFSSDAGISFNAYGNGNFTFNNLVSTPSLAVTGIRTITSSASALQSDFQILVNTSSGAVTYTLPDAFQFTGRLINVKKIDSSSNNVTIAPSGTDKIDGASLVIFSAQWTNKRLISDGTNWFLQ